MQLTDASGGESGDEANDFVFKFKDFSMRSCTLTAPIPIPLSIHVHEYACRLMTAHDIPCYLEPGSVQGVPLNVTKDFTVLGVNLRAKSEIVTIERTSGTRGAVKMYALTEALEGFVSRKTEHWHQKNASAVVNAVRGADVSLERLASSWARAFSEEHVAYSSMEKISNEAVFSDMYHTLVHSPALDTLLSLEHSYAVQMEALVRNRDLNLKQLEARQTQVMEDTVQRLGLSTTDVEVNALAVKQLEDIQMLESKWESEISALREMQKREFQEWIAKVHEDYHTSGGTATFMSCSNSEGGAEHWLTNTSRLEESFTIHLGAQLKQMHNLRLLSADVLDLCHFKPVAAQNVVPQRLQTAMSLYSTNLCGLVILVDSRVNSYSGIKRDFARVCQTSTEFHFPGLEDQLEAVRDHLTKVGHWRATNEILSGVAKPVGEGQPPQVPMLRPGDVYMTRHSNLAEVHVVFHVVVDDSIRSTDISSRHPVILALRNVLKVACLCDVTTVTMPLLLVHEMSEEMTMSWCLKRSELIYKCVKGFMIEMASWGGAESRTVQFLVPKGISDDLFSNLSTMLPSIFRTSNPLKVNVN